MKQTAGGPRVDPENAEFRDQLIAASLKLSVNFKPLADRVLIPRSADRGLIEATLWRATRVRRPQFRDQLIAASLKQFGDGSGLLSGGNSAIS